MFFQFIEQDSVFLADILAVCRNQKEQRGITLNMPQEPVSKPFTFCRPLDDPGNVSNDKTFEIPVFDDPQVGFERGELVIGNLGFG